jgi:hypothetical protein
MTFPLENPQLIKPLAHADVVETPPRPASPEYRFGTRAVHSGAHIDPGTGAVIAPVSSTSPLQIKGILLIVLDFTIHNICTVERRKTNWYL